MTPLRRAELLCTVGRIIVWLAYVIGAIPAAVALIAFCIYLVGRTILDNGNRQWNDLHNIENPPLEPLTAAGEADRIARILGIKG